MSVYLFIYTEGQNPWSINNRTQGPLHRSTPKRPVDITENRVGTSIRALQFVNYECKRFINLARVVRSTVNELSPCINSLHFPRYDTNKFASYFLHAHVANFKTLDDLSISCNTFKR